MSQSEHAKINGNKCEIPHLDYYFYGRFGEIWLSIILCKNRHRLLAQLMIKSRAILHGVNRNIAWKCEREKSQTLNWLDEICGLMSGYKRAIGNKWYWTVTKKKKKSVYHHIRWLNWGNGYAIGIWGPSFDLKSSHMEVILDLFSKGQNLLHKVNLNFGPNLRIYFQQNCFVKPGILVLEQSLEDRPVGWTWWASGFQWEVGLESL